MFKDFFHNLLELIRGIVNMKDDTDYESTTDAIRRSIEFRGANVWILAFAIIVASVGLNVNSTAVIIGAMLISPLMGPINGVGLAVGIFDNTLLKQSLKNLLIMVAISLLASTTYFVLSPLSDAQSELLARTRPTIYDVLIAFFGGLAGIVAISRKNQPITIIAGVSIATALMPPLCTAGYGLASGKLTYFFGAFYLFFLNSVFIALATVLMVRHLNFPHIEFVNPERKRKVKKYISLFCMIIIVPSVIMAFGVIKETTFNSDAIKYINSIRNNELYNEVEIVNTHRKYDSKTPKIFISFIGKALTPQQVEYLNNQLKVFDLQDVQLEIKETGGTLDLGAQTGIISELLAKKEEELQDKNEKIKHLTQELNKTYSSIEVRSQVSKEILALYPDVISFSVVNSIHTTIGSLKQDTIPILFINWKEGYNVEDNDKLADWLQVRLGTSSLEVYSTVTQNSYQSKSVIKQ